MIHMKCQDLFSLKNTKKTTTKFRMSSATNFAWGLRVKEEVCDNSGVIFLI